MSNNYCAVPTTRPITEKLHKRLWRFCQPFGPIPAGFVTDGASVPRIFWAFLDPGTELFEAAVIHDYYLSVGDIEQANEAFKAYALAFGVPRYKVSIAHFVVVHYFALKSLWSKA